MDRGTWQATVHGVTRVGHSLVTKRQQLSFWGFSFALGCGVSFFGGIQHSPVDGCSAASCNFEVLAGEDERIIFYSTILNFPTRGRPKSLFVYR